MTDQDQNKACAELDGWTTSTGFGGVGLMHSPKCTCFDGEPCAVPNYGSSYDAIIPLIQKQLEKMIIWSEMFEELSKITTPCDCGQHWAAWAFRFTPAQLREALLRATGKWKE